MVFGMEYLVLGMEHLVFGMEYLVLECWKMYLQLPVLCPEIPNVQPSTEWVIFVLGAHFYKHKNKTLGKIRERNVSYVHLVAGLVNQLVGGEVEFNLVSAAAVGLRLIKGLSRGQPL